MDKTPNEFVNYTQSRRIRKAHVVESEDSSTFFNKNRISIIKSDRIDLLDACSKQRRYLVEIRYIIISYRYIT
jgi:hypothetical protein